LLLKIEAFFKEANLHLLDWEVRKNGMEDL